MLAYVNLVAEFSKYLGDNLGKPINLATIGVFGEFVHDLFVLIVQDNQKDQTD